MSWGRPRVEGFVFCFGEEKKQEFNFRHVCFEMSVNLSGCQIQIIWENRSLT